MVVGRMQKSRGRRCTGNMEMSSEPGGVGIEVDGESSVDETVDIEM